MHPSRPRGPHGVPRPAVALGRRLGQSRGHERVADRSPEERAPKRWSAYLDALAARDWTALARRWTPTSSASARTTTPSAAATPTAKVPRRHAAPARRLRAAGRARDRDLGRRARRAQRDGRHAAGQAPHGRGGRLDVSSAGLIVRVSVYLRRSVTEPGDVGAGLAGHGTTSTRRGLHLTTVTLPRPAPPAGRVLSQPVAPCGRRRSRTRSCPRRCAWFMPARRFAQRNEAPDAALDAVLRAVVERQLGAQRALWNFESAS